MSSDNIFARTSTYRVSITTIIYFFFLFGGSAMADDFETKNVQSEPTHTAPDGMEVRELHTLDNGGMAIFTLAPRKVANPTKHKTVEEIWFFLSGRGQLWRKNEKSEEIVDVYPGISLTIPPETAFQLRSMSDEPLEAIGQTMPPWPGKDEAYENVSGVWEPTVNAQK